MGQGADKKLVIIGMGYLMEYITPCYEALLGDNIAENILAVTADGADLARKQAACAFPVVLDDSAGALRRLQPDLILFAPPPSAAPMLIDDVLAPYFAECRAAGRTLPVIYAFPPNPVGRHYLEVLGEDVLVANILPNMVTRLGDTHLGELGLTYVTFPEEGPWPEAERRFLEEFFAPMGGTIEVKPAHVMEMLAGTVAVHLISQIIFTLTDSLAAGGHPVDYRGVASAMRAVFRRERGYGAGELPCGLEDLGDHYLAGLCGKVVLAWYDGMVDFYLGCGMDPDSATRILSSLLDLHLLKHQLEAREEIEAKAAQHATRGGVLEKGTLLFPGLVQTMLQQAFYPYPHTRLSPEWLGKLSARAGQLCRVTTEHSRKLDKGKERPPFLIEHHAVAFGLLAKHTVDSGVPGGEEALSVGVIRYCRERGMRMRQRCDRFGDPVNMLGYKVYCEWQPENEVMTAVTVQRSPVHKTEVTDCHWVNDWRRYGLLDYGKYYCDWADYNLVKGFSEDMNLEMGKIFSRGADCCAFTWCGADMTDENEAWINARRAELLHTITCDWEFHTAHLYHTVSRALRSALGPGMEGILERMRAEYASLFGEEALAVIDSFENHDFTVATYR